MLISKFDLYKPEWLELVFENRNKDYGAYYLRQHYAGNMNRAMFITFSGITLLFIGSVIFKNAPTAPQHKDDVVVVTLSDPKIIKPITLPKNPDVPVTPPKPLAAVRTTQLVQFVVKPDNTQTVNPPVIVDIQGPIGPVTTPGKDDGINATPTTPGPGTQAAPDETIHTTFGLEEMPMPVGGESAWAKFLNRNLRFPGEAQERGVSGRVILSFIIEKDGSLSNIEVVHIAGYGFDEEALRVLKLAKPWKPGKQNGQLVRVKYNIPINFQLADNN
ncbi:MAG TPA: energy transducer TonB [Mucilaginibacter sp.]|jgi:protein TonB